MNTKVQIIEDDQGPEYAVIPYKDYERLINIAENLADIQDAKDWKESPGETFPSGVVDQLLDGVNPIRVYRKYRKLTQEELAEKIGVAGPYVSQLETQQDKNASLKLYQQIAKALNVGLEDIIPDV